MNKSISFFQNTRMYSQNNWGWKGLWRSFNATPLPRLGHLEQAAQIFLYWIGIEYLFTSSGITHHDLLRKHLPLIQALPHRIVSRREMNVLTLCWAKPTNNLFGNPGILIPFKYLINKILRRKVSTIYIYHYYWLSGLKADGVKHELVWPWGLFNMLMQSSNIHFMAPEIMN